MTITDIIPWKKKGDILPDRGRDADLIPEIRQEMNRLVDEFFERPLGLSPFFSHTSLSKDFSPVLDISETEKEIVIKAELPGLEPEEIDVSLDRGVLTISGEKQAKQEQKGEHYYQIERSYGSFQRSVALPAEVDEEKIKAIFKRGVLNIVLPKTKAALEKRRKITIKTG